MPAGRPSIYTPELIAKAREYVDGKWEFYDHIIPSVQGLCVVLGISEFTAYNWAKDEEKAEFSKILAEIKTKQHHELINKGLKGDINAAITKLALGKHGYSDKVEAEHTGPGGGPVQMQVSQMTREELMKELEARGLPTNILDN
jgi:hypothetical protein